MHSTQLVKRLQRGRYLLHQRYGFGRFQRFISAGKPLLQRFTIHLSQ
jgi:hypothetical protein